VGVIEGEADGGRVAATWTVDLGWETMDLELEGFVRDGFVELELDQDMGRGGTFEAFLYAERQ
jgi:hypothetical protein